MAERHEFVVLPGVEISTDDGHILAFGVEKYVFGMHRAGRLAAHVAERGGCLVAAHPYRRQIPWKDEPEAWRRGLERAAENPAYQHCVALEVLNGRGSERENRFSLELSEGMRLPGTAGTDSHAVHDIGTVATYFEAERIETWQQLVAELKGRRFYAVDMATGQEYAVPAPQG